MTYRGHVKQGVIVLNPPAVLPEGMEVEVRASEPSVVDAARDGGDQAENGILALGSVAAASAVLPKEDFSDWEN